MGESGKHPTIRRSESGCVEVLWWTQSSTNCRDEYPRSLRPLAGLGSSSQSEIVSQGGGGRDDEAYQWQTAGSLLRLGSHL